MTKRKLSARWQNGKGYKEVQRRCLEGKSRIAGGYLWCAVKDWYPGWKPKKEYSDIYKKKFPTLSKY